MQSRDGGVETSKWRGTLEEGFLLRDPQVAGKAELLQLRTVCESGAQNLKHVCLEQINSLQLLAARTGGGAYPVEVCRQGKCDNARLQKTAVRQASVWVRCVRLAYLN